MSCYVCHDGVVISNDGLLVPYGLMLGCFCIALFADHEINAFSSNNLFVQEICSDVR